MPQYRGPNIWPMRPPMFRQQPQTLPSGTPPGAINALQQPAPSPSSSNAASALAGLRGPFSAPNSIPEDALTVPSAADPSQIGGWMKREEGPGLGGQEWLDRLLSMQEPPAYQPSQEDLYRRAGPATPNVSFGGQAQAQQQLKDQLADEQFARALSQSEQTAIQNARMSLNPDVQQAQEAEAVRGTYPARVTAAGGLAQQQEASRGLLGVAQETQRGLANRASAFQELRETLTPGESISMSGIGSVRAPQERQVPTGLSQQLTVLRRIYTDDPSPANKAGLDQAISSILASVPVQNDYVKELVWEVLNDPQRETQSTDDIISSSDMTPDEAQDFRNLMLRVRESR